ncbi:ATP-binding cassette domain-containing protein [Xenophilus azovorans]|uniref:ATP-binding cassette domain-containing protein n=1 Tax=Xenophilus azovorans TaxID=151755 RepID=UPI00068D3F3A|nr:ATP-binding cassette domain-containing protein [Xenophilus azovorans]
MSSAARLGAVARLFAAAQGRGLALGLLLAVLTVLAGIGLLGLAGWFITATALAGAQVATALVFDVFMPSAGIRLLALGRTLSRYGERLATHDATLGVLAALRERLFRAWSGPRAARLLQLRPARLLLRLTADIDALETLYLRLLVPAAATFGAALAAGAVVGMQDAVLGMGLFAWLLAVGWGSAWLLARRAARPAAQRGAAVETLRARTADLVAGRVELAMAGRLQAQCRAIAASDARIAANDARLQRLEGRALFAHGAAAALTLAGVLLGAAWLAEQGRIGAPVAALMLLVALAAPEPLGALRRGALDAGRALLAVRRLGPALSECDAPSGCAAEAGPSAADAGAVRLHDVRCVRDGEAHAAFVVPWLAIEPGERVALVGASGAGKSTLLALIAGELAPQAGRIQAPAAAWLTQRIDLFQDSLRDNLRLADPDATDARLDTVLAAAGLAGDVRALPQGLDTLLGEGGQGLSGGQARRLALARLLLQRRPLWLLDECTEALDARTARDVLARLDAGSRTGGRTMLIATHLRREAALADRLLRVEHGRIASALRRGEPGFDALLAGLRAD